MSHHLACILVAATTIIGSVADSVFSEPAIFERLSHFVDYGVPGTIHDPLNQAMIADASCRAATSDNYDGYAFYHDSNRVHNVIKALSNLPSTSLPSHFTIATHSALPKVCSLQSSEDVDTRQSSDDTSMKYQCSILPLQSLASSMDNWHRALCANATDSSWKGTYDPAYQPQQIALTAGFMCMVTCDCNEKQWDQSSRVLAAFAANDAMAKDVKQNLCSALPYHSINFTKQAATPTELASLSLPLSQLCGC
jgi:hypothetical protein